MNQILTVPDQRPVQWLARWAGRCCLAAVMLGYFLGGHARAITISEIQGGGKVSQFVGQALVTTGVVTAVKINGFFIQSLPAHADGNSATSEGILAFTSSAPPAAAAVSNLVMVVGTVSEFQPAADTNSLSVTEILPTSITLLGTGNSLPEPVLLSELDLFPGAPIDQLERYEGMRVQVNGLQVVAPTEGILSEVNATAQSSGVFFGVLPSTARPFREPGVRIPDPLPPGAPCCIPRFDANAELLRIDSDAQVGATALEVKVGDTVSNLVGVLDYLNRANTLLPDRWAPPTVVAGVPPTPMPVPRADELLVATLHLDRLYDAVDGPGADLVLTAGALSNRLGKISRVIREHLHSPDILAVQEVENLATLQSLANRINSDALAAGQTAPNYQPILYEGNDGLGLDVACLYRSNRVAIVASAQEGKTLTYINPLNGLTETLFDRPPVALNTMVTLPGVSGSLPVILLACDLRNLSGIDDPAEGVKVRAKRWAQAEYLANLVNVYQTLSPGINLIMLGSLNGYEFNDGYVDTLGTITGMPTPSNEVVSASADLVAADLQNTSLLVLATNRYSLTVAGSAQALDHVLISRRLKFRLTRTMFARVNSDFPETFRNDVTRAERAGVRDPVAAYFSLSARPYFTSVSRGSNGQVSLLASGDPLGTNLVQMATNLYTQNWFTLGPVTTNAAGELSFLDLGATNSNQRFYRILSP